MDFALLQLCDSAFPSGAFAHSFGFEALKQLGHLREGSLVLRLEEFVWHTAHGALPLLNEAHARDAVRADLCADAFLSNHIANRASRAQGQAFLLAAEATFDAPGVSALRTGLPCGHVAVAMGAALRVAGMDLRSARQLLLFSAVRGAISACVRLGVVGPLRAQKQLFGLHSLMERALEETKDLTANDAASCAPLLDLCQGTQDRLYSRLFQS